MNLDKVETEYALQRFEEFYNTQRLGSWLEITGNSLYYKALAWAATTMVARVSPTGESAPDGL